MASPTKAELAARVVEAINAVNEEPRSPDSVARLAKLLKRDELETVLRYYTHAREHAEETPGIPGPLDASLVRKVVDAVGYSDPAQEPEPAETPAPVAPEPEPTTDAAIVVAEPVKSTAIVARPLFPAMSEWQVMQTIANEVCRTNIMPADLRTPAATLLVLLAAHDLDIPPTQAFNKLYVVEGRLTMSAELMVAQILRYGHDIWPDPNNDATKATAHCIRKGTQRIVSVTFTIQDAVAAELCTIENGKVRSRSRDGKKSKPWELYTADMLWARAVSRAARRRFPDCLAGVTYTPEELGNDAIEWDIEELEREQHRYVDIPKRIEELKLMVGSFTDDEKAALAESWKAAHIPKLGDIETPEHLQTYEGLVDRVIRIRNAAVDADRDVIHDAEIVEDDGPMCAAACGERLMNGEPLSDTWPGYHSACEPFDDAKVEA